MASTDLTDTIAFVDLAAQHAEIADEVARGWEAVFERTDFVLGAEVEMFEQAFARFCGTSHCIGVGNGTDAVEFALRSVGVGAGDEVIVPTNSFVASAMGVLRAGAVPVLVDVDPATLLIEPERVAERIGPRTRAILPVHLFGQTAPVEALRTLADDQISIVEDAAQAQGARRFGVAAGALGDVAATSFYPGKNLGAYGDAGAILTSRREIADTVRALRNHGSSVKYQHPEIGFNSRLDTLQAVVLAAKLQRLDAWNEARRSAAARYDALLADEDRVRSPQTLIGNEHVWHLYVVRVPQRDAVLRHLMEAGIGAGIHYPTPIHLQGAFRSMGYAPGAFPVAEEAARCMISLPMHPHLSPDQQERVVDELTKALG